MRTRDNKKIRGDIFEEFSVLYLRAAGYENVWRLEDVPEDILTSLSLKRTDMGIDIVCQKGGVFSAVQCKYKTPTGRKMGITWKILSTFYALCMRSGPWDKYIVMTNCNFVSHAGKKTEKDVSLSLHAFQSITQEQWLAMCGSVGTALPTTGGPLTPEQLREARLKRFASPPVKI
jgi:hypothetical protein